MFPPRSRLLLAAALAATSSLAQTACSRAPAEPTPGPAPTAAAASTPTPSSASSASAAPPMAGSQGAKLALAWDDPPRWKRHPPASAMRAAEYLVPHAPGDTDDAECTVITFGPGQGGTVDDNIERWVKQLEGASAPSRSTRSVHGMNVTRVEVTGTYAGMRMPGAPPAAPHPGYRLIGVIVEAPSGAWFFKLTGPDATVKAASKEMDALVDSARPAGN